MPRKISLVEGELQDILYMLEDYIMNAEDKLAQYRDFEIEEDEDLQVEQANLAVAIRLHDKVSGKG